MTWARRLTNPDVKRFVGLSDDVGQKLGLSRDWARNIVKAVGNYGEIFDRNLGPNSPIELTRGQNALWSGRRLCLMSPPFRIDACSWPSVHVECDGRLQSMLDVTDLISGARTVRNRRTPYAADHSSAKPAFYWRSLLLRRLHDLANLISNIERLNLHLGFGFLSRPAGFEIAQTPISYPEGATYLRAFVIAFLNTVLISAIAIVCATVLGFFVALSRLSSNPLLSAVALAYIEAVRNIPLLVAASSSFWYFAVLDLLLPLPRDISIEPVRARVPQQAGADFSRSYSA